jgi:RNA polymerase sigma factor (sigma-70 family)
MIPKLADRLSGSDYEPLTQQQVSELGERLQAARESGDREEESVVKEELIRRHMRMIPHVGKTYRLDFEETLAIGSLALTQAVERWRPEKGSLYGYAERYITTALNKGIDADRTIRIPEQVSYKAAKVQKRINEISGELGRELTRDERAQVAGEHARFDDLPTVSDSLDRPLADHGDGANRTLADTIQDAAADPYQEVERRMLAESLHKALLELNPIEQDVIRARFGLDDGEKVTLAELGDRYGVTGEAMRRLEATAISKLRHPSLVNQFIDE